MPDRPAPTIRTSTCSLPSGFSKNRPRAGAAPRLCCTDVIDALSNESTGCRETGPARYLRRVAVPASVSPAPRGRRSVRALGRRPGAGDPHHRRATARRAAAGAISVDDLARGAGISRPTFYFYFASKDAVLLTLLDRVVAEADAATQVRPSPAREAGRPSRLHDTFRPTGRYRPGLGAAVRRCGAGVRGLGAAARRSRPSGSAAPPRRPPARGHRRRAQLDERAGRSTRPSPATGRGGRGRRGRRPAGDLAARDLRHGAGGVEADRLTRRRAAPSARPISRPVARSGRRHRARRVVHELVADRAEQQPGEAAAPRAPTTRRFAALRGGRSAPDGACARRGR